jgi:hypothetical protein
LSQDLCLNAIRSVDAKTYERHDLNNQKRIGFIAQEIGYLQIGI